MKITADCEQHNKWVVNVIDKQTRIETMYQRWKNVTTIKACGHCQKTTVKMKKCSNCQNVFYCSFGCQKRHYREHKSVCRNITK